MISRFVMLAVAFATASASWGRVIPLDPDSQEPTHDQITRALKTPTTGPTTRESLRAEADAKLAAIEREVARLRTLGDRGAARADALERKLRDLRDRRDGKIVMDDRPELHVVNVQTFDRRSDTSLTPKQRRRQFKVTAGPIVVEVQPTGRPIVLAICSPGPTKWDLRIAKDANVKRVLVGGYDIQQITGVPEGIPVEIHTYEGTPRSENYFFRFGAPFSDPSEDGAVRLKKLTDLDIATLQIDKWYRGQPIVVGPGNVEWALQRLLLDLRPVYLEAAAYEIAQQRAAVRDVRFKAVRAPIPPKAPEAVPVPGGPARNAAMIRVQAMRAVSEARPALAEFTPAGPIDGTDAPLPQRANHVAIDPNDSTVYAIDEHEVYRVDPRTGQGTQLKLDNPDLPRISWMNGITFDTKRRRVLVSALNMLYAFDPATQKWSGVVNLENLRAMSFTYAAAEDCFYAVLTGMGAPGGGGPATLLMRYTADGDPTALIELTRPIPIEMFRPDGVPQLIAVGSQLVLLSNPSRFEVMRFRGGDAPALPRQKLFVIDPKTGEVTFQTTVVPQGGDAKLTDEELADAWFGLVGGEPEAMEAAAKRLASGGDAAVALIRSRLIGESNVDPQVVAEHLTDLDHEDFTRRDGASRELRRLGPAVEPILRDALAKQPSAEAKSRIESILSELQPASPRDRNPTRQSIAIAVLGRIGTPAAIDYLGEFAAGPADSLRTKDARAALREFARED
jgi:hypothetical protein